ncbi:MAG: 16S rRNA (cytosine(1402)-N(4))-methyltransferase RsmH [Dehalococcoidales bacterium]
MNFDGSVAIHTPVLLDEALDALAVQPGGRYIDCTIGGGGHAAAILERSAPGGQLLGIDADPEAIKVAGERLKAYQESVLLVNDNFARLQPVCLNYDFQPVHGILFDLGVSSLQLSDSGRGFSFQYDAPLDMRFSPQQDTSVEDIVNHYSESEIARIIRVYGEENYYQRIARRIVSERPIKTTMELARTVERAVGGRKGKIHPATRTFQALRIAVNHELEILDSALKQAVEILGYGGRLVVISYHSLEDRIVKQFMQREAKGCICGPEVPVCVCGHTASLRMLNKRVIRPSDDEIRHNPRSRSARLRAAQSIASSGGYYEVVERLSALVEGEHNGWRRPALMEKLRTIYLAS